MSTTASEWPARRRAELEAYWTARADVSQEQMEHDRSMARTVQVLTDDEVRVE
jgi:hypothetical protein